MSYLTFPLSLCSPGLPSWHYLTGWRYVFFLSSLGLNAFPSNFCAWLWNMWGHCHVFGIISGCCLLLSSPPQNNGVLSSFVHHPCQPHLLSSLLASLTHTSKSYHNQKKTCLTRGCKGISSLLKLLAPRLVGGIIVVFNVLTESRSL